jgi:hypothetical protein
MDSRAAGKRVIDYLIRAVILGGMFVVAVPVALVLAMCGASPGVIMGAMGACGLVGAAIGRAATVPRRGSFPASPALRPKRAPQTR